MINRRQFLVKTGPILSLTFSWLALVGRAAEVTAPTRKSWTFEEFASSCIDLGHYDANKRQLTGRFVNKKTERFYRYSNVGPEIWEKMRKLHESGGVGGYLIETIVQDPKQYPFEELSIREFKVTPKKRRIGASSQPTFKASPAR